KAMSAATSRDAGRRDIQWDHTRDFAKGGETSEANLRPLCRFHHREKTAGRLVRKDARWLRTGDVAQMWTPP
ncbi:MAG TPA: HNH endonuclease signature motif containing protein, partial [Acidimicrobiales bacterium]|nr:HNH endonuclease signature motif containing protein [Acidimicrobiales bacterium]